MSSGENSPSQARGEMLFFREALYLGGKWKRRGDFIWEKHASQGLDRVKSCSGRKKCGGEAWALPRGFDRNKYGITAARYWTHYLSAHTPFFHGYSLLMPPIG